jgi:hypothetical protein
MSAADALRRRHQEELGESAKLEIRDFADQLAIAHNGMAWGPGNWKTESLLTNWLR